MKKEKAVKSKSVQAVKSKAVKPVKKPAVKKIRLFDPNRVMTSNAGGVKMTIRRKKRDYGKATDTATPGSKVVRFPFNPNPKEFQMPAVALRKIGSLEGPFVDVRVPGRPTRNKCLATPVVARVWAGDERNGMGVIVQSFLEVENTFPVGAKVRWAGGTKESTAKVMPIDGERPDLGYTFSN